MPEDLVDCKPDSKVHGANMGHIWGRQDPGGPHVGPMNFANWEGSLLRVPETVLANKSHNIWRPWAAMSYYDYRIQLFLCSEVGSVTKLPTLLTT